MSRFLKVAAAATAAMLALAACGGNDDKSTDSSSGSGSASDVQAALDKGGTLTVWAWDQTIKDVATAFQAKYPKVKINLVNAGTGDKQYTALQNAVAAGSGVPDVAQIEYYAVLQFALSKSLANISGYGAASLKSDFTPGPWNAVTPSGGVYGLPLDSGPMALFYNKEVFDELDLDVPTTWDEYVEAGRTIRQEKPESCIVNDSGDAGFTTSMIWQAGGTPFQTDGESVTIDLADEGTQKWTGVWNQLIEDELACDIAGWTEEWYKALGDGTIATMPIGAWAPGVFASSVPDGAGKWRVAPMPTYDGEAATAENGGSAQSVLKQSDDPDLAAAFVRWLNHDEGIEPFLESGGFPATVDDLKDPEFVSKKDKYFGNQAVNEVLTAAADDVVEGWQYLPFQLYANTIFGDTVGKAYQAHSDLNAGLESWQDALVEYGNEQGFQVNE